jgi:putative hydroxymethylpyrimidine transport system substrate-binding protein
VTRRLIAALLALAAVLSLAACGEKSDDTGAPTTESLRLMLDYLPNADHAGIYQAQGGGDFERAGLKVDIETPADPATPLKLLVAGKVDVAISYEPEVLLARDQGAKIVSIGALVQKPLTSLMAVPPKASSKDKHPDPGVTSVKQLAGKTIGTAGIPYQSAYLKTILQQAGVDPSSVKEVNVGFNLIPVMLSGKADATLGAFWNIEGVELQRAKRNPWILPVDQAGVPTYDELVFAVREDTARSRGPVLRAFLRALAQAHERLRSDPEQGIQPLLSANPDLDRDTTLAQVQKTIPAFFPANEKEPFGWQDGGAWGEYGNWMFDHQLLKARPLPRSITNEFLPGAGLQDANDPTAG